VSEKHNIYVHGKKIASFLRLSPSLSALSRYFYDNSNNNSVNNNNTINTDSNYSNKKYSNNNNNNNNNNNIKNRRFFVIVADNALTTEKVEKVFEFFDFLSLRGILLFRSLYHDYSDNRRCESGEREREKERRKRREDSENERGKENDDDVYYGRGKIERRRSRVEGEKVERERTREDNSEKEDEERVRNNNNNEEKAEKVKRKREREEDENEIIRKKNEELFSSFSRFRVSPRRSYLPLFVNVFPLTKNFFRGYPGAVFSEKLKKIEGKKERYSIIIK